MAAKKLTKSASFNESHKRPTPVIIEIALAEVKKNGEFTLPGIGKLVMQKRKARMGRNPKTGEHQDCSEDGGEVPGGEGSEGLAARRKIGALFRSGF